MSFRQFNCHHIHARNGQEVPYQSVSGHARLGLYLNMAQMEVICPSLYIGSGKEQNYNDDYTLIVMSAGDAYVVEGTASEIADHVTGTLPLRHINLEKLQNVGGNVQTYGTAKEAWVQPDSVESIEKSGYRDQGYTDGVSRATLLLKSGTIITLYGVVADTIANTSRWFMG